MLAGVCRTRDVWVFSVSRLGPRQPLPDDPTSLIGSVTLFFETVFRDRAGCDSFPPPSKFHLAPRSTFALLIHLDAGPPSFQLSDADGVVGFPLPSGGFGRSMHVAFLPPQRVRRLLPRLLRFSFSGSFIPCPRSCAMI